MSDGLRIKTESGETINVNDGSDLAKAGFEPVTAEVLKQYSTNDIVRCEDIIIEEIKSYSGRIDPEDIAMRYEMPLTLVGGCIDKLVEDGIIGEDEDMEEDNKFEEMKKNLTAELESNNFSKDRYYSYEIDRTVVNVELESPVIDYVELVKLVEILKKYGYTPAVMASIQRRAKGKIYGNPYLRFEFPVASSGVDEERKE